MATYSILQLAPVVRGRETQHDGQPSLLATLHGLIRDPLPDDVRHCEATTAALFRASQILNLLTGGNPDMTFSARCHRARRTARFLPARFGWRVAECGIDAVCGILRGEEQHCTVAWINYVTRPRRRPLPR